MPRQVPFGTPVHPTQYVLPARRWKLLWASMASGAGLLITLLILHASGRREVASPGPVIGDHEAFATACEYCHAGSAPHRVANLRCERCHDPRMTGEMTTAAHAAGSRRTFSEAACVSCHRDHQGQQALLRRVHDRECIRCHVVAASEGHPAGRRESARAVSTSLRFEHERHVAEARRTLGAGCEACHRLTASLAGFEPLSFDTHCASCHAKEGRLLGISEPVPSDVPAGSAKDASPLPTFRPAGRGRVVVSNMRHRDPWILGAVRQLGGRWPADVPLSSQPSLEAERDRVRRALTSPLLADRDSSDLEQLLDTRRAAPAGNSHPTVATAPGTNVQQLALAVERVQLELELRESAVAAPPSLVARLGQERALRERLTTVESNLAFLATAEHVRPRSGDARGGRERALEALLVPCLVCHRLEGTAFLPVGATTPVHIGARFTHASHVTRTPCETCHPAVSTSHGARAVAVPTVRECQRCHRISRAPSACVDCHTYHASPSLTARTTP